jgi:hypothetical protein
VEYGYRGVDSNPRSSSLLAEERADDAVSTFSVASPWAPASQDELKEVEDQRPVEETKEPFPNDFIRESFRFVEWLCNAAVAGERRKESHARGEIYLARGVLDFPCGQQEKRAAQLICIHTLPRSSIPSRTEDLAGQFPRVDRDREPSQSRSSSAIMEWRTEAAVGAALAIVRRLGTVGMDRRVAKRIRHGHPMSRNDS